MAAEDQTDEQRWARAHALLAGAHDIEAEDQASRRRRLARRTSLTLVGLGVLAVALFVFLLVHHHPHRAVSRPPAWASVVGIALTLLGVGVEVVTLVLLLAIGRRGGCLHRRVS